MLKYPDEPIEVPRFCEANGFSTTISRSKVMSKIRGKGTIPEVLLRNELWRKGYRYATNVKSLPGCPDVVFKGKKLAVFVDGSFWHGYNWSERKEKLNSNKSFWIPKIERNIQRDTEVGLKFAQMGWALLRFWDHEVIKELSKCIDKIEEELASVQFSKERVVPSYSVVAIYNPRPLIDDL